MTLTQGNISVTIDDNSPEALKIAQGYDYTIDPSGKIIIGSLSPDVNTKYQVVKALKAATTLDQVKTILIKYILLQ